MIKRFLKIFAVVLIFLVAAKLDKEIRSFSLVDKTSTYIRSYFTAKSQADQQFFLQIKQQARDKAIFYDSQIEQRFLDDGMVVNRTSDGGSIDHCDSLLFSSLRFIALDKLGLKQRALASWEALRMAEESAGRWRRHPKCNLSTSRDMIIGLLAALTRSPPEHQKLLKSIIENARANHGFIDDGPIDVSYLTPGSMMLLNHVAKQAGVVVKPGKSLIPLSFPTLMFDLAFVERGFSAHLSALTIWIELELKDKRIKGTTPSSVFSQDHLLDWYAQKLVEVDPQNLFFRWLKLKTAGALSSTTRLAMLDELMHMEQFPPDTLPQSCNRKADYLWQRDSAEYQPVEHIQCTKLFAGIDFMWMVALLVDDAQDRFEESESSTLAH